jgi:hypothetical protein
MKQGSGGQGRDDGEQYRRLMLCFLSLRGEPQGDRERASELGTPPPHPHALVLPTLPANTAAYVRAGVVPCWRSFRRVAVRAAFSFS